MRDQPELFPHGVEMPQPDGLPLTWRRWLFAGLTVASFLALTGLMAYALTAGGGFDGLDLALLTLFAMTLPWTVIGFWNAAIGFGLLRLTRDPLAIVLPASLRAATDDAVRARTAILVCVRNEAAEPVFQNLAAMLDGLIAAGLGDRFDAHMLSDSNQPALIADEEARFAVIQAGFAGRVALHYRRRTDNPGFKAGNIREFCLRAGAGYDFALVLDADSYMSPFAILRLVRMMQADPRLGILQSLVVGKPSDSAFARVFQFGMRLGMRSFTLGSAWWQGDCGPYWGHNALIRLAPFIEHGELPKLPGKPPLGGWILSHDQVEAVLMRRAGYAVRVVPDEEGSWEENPPTLLEFIRRDLRWAQGNMQYWRLLTLKGLLPISRYQLMLAILMFTSAPAWIGFMVVGLLRSALETTPTEMFRPDAGGLLFVVIMTMVWAPKVASILDVALSRGGMQRFGGGWRFWASVAMETLFSILLAPIMAVAQTLFLGGLALGRNIGWTAQTRVGHGVPLGSALRRLWPQTLVGLIATTWFLHASLAAVLGAATILAGLVGAIPFAMFSAWPRLGAALSAIGIGQIPEETDPPPALRVLER